VRLQAPRFFVVGDVLTISAVINNNTDQKIRVADKLEAEGLVISGLYVGTNVSSKANAAPYVDVGPTARPAWIGPSPSPNRRRAAQGHAVVTNTPTPWKKPTRFYEAWPRKIHLQIRQGAWG